MKRIVYVVLLLCISVLDVEAGALNLKDITNGLYKEKDITAVTPLADGIHYVAASNNNTRIVKYEYRTGKAVETLFDVATARECNLKKFEGFSLSEDEKQLLIWDNSEKIYRRSFKAEYYTFEIKRNLLKPLSENGKQQVAVFSPNGRMVAFVRDNNIFVKKLDYGTELPVTRDGARNKIINGIPDWVYEEEFAFTSTLQWAPDNETLCFVKFDESNVPEYHFDLYEGSCPAYPQYALYPGSFEYKYPVAGENNAKVSVWSYTVETRALKQLNVPVDADGYIPRILFTRDADKLAVMTLNRIQNTLNIYTVNPKSGVNRLLLREQSNTWIDSENIDCVTFYPDFFVIASERSGFRHLYQYNLNGTLIKQITKGNWDVTDFLGYDNVNRTFFYQSAEEGPLFRAIYKTDAKGAVIKLSDKKGTNKAEFNPSCTYFINKYNSTSVPLEITLCDAKGKQVRVLEDNNSLKNLVARTDIPRKEFFTCKNDAGDMLNGYMIKPLDFDASRRYPVVMVQYSGPGSQLVLDKWDVNWEQYLVSRAFIVACVDGRGTGARGNAFKTCVYMKLGELETQDQVSAARYMASLPYVDGKNIGIWGWSYGGYETLMAMSLSRDVYKAGVAIAPVTDWRFYDSIYAERYMRTPKENFDGYKRSAPLNHTEEQNGDLLVVSGTADDNVHLLNTLQYSSVMVESNKQFDMMIYTNKNHSIVGCNARYHLYTKVCDFFTDKLK